MDRELEISLIIDPVIKRLDGHGVNLRSLEDKLDNKFSMIMAKIESIKDFEHKEHKEMDVRLVKIESERGIIYKIMGFLFGLVGGFGGGWVQHFFKLKD